jgi:ubiquinone/menaquinone biosynthesis C-methylase UbiE
MSPLARATEHELLDDPGLARHEVERNLREMSMLNRLPGGVADSCRAVSRLLDGEAEASVLDVGIGSGDFARRLARDRDGVRIIGLDVRDDVLRIAARTLAGRNHVTLIAGDARAVPLPDRSVDVAHASLLLHHLDPEDAVRALREMRRVARRGVVINDLRRGLVPFAMTATVVLALARSPVTRHDGVLSARRAHTLAELDTLASRAGLRRVARSAAFLPRVTTVYA